MIYFDNAATSRPLGSAAEAAVSAAQFFGNPSSLHGVGLAASQIVSSARSVIAGSIGASPEEIFFLSGATEANNTAVFGAANRSGKRRRRIVITSVEHPAVSAPCRVLQESGYEIVRIEPKGRTFSPDDLVSAVDENTCLVSYMLCNNETGTILPVSEAFRRIKKRYPAVLTHCDAVQGYMKIPVSVKKMHADMVSLSGHKVHAFKGIGALYVKKGVHISPMMYGGGQENGFRSGTEPVPAIASFGAAVKELSENINERYAHVSDLSAYMNKRMSELPFVHINDFPDSSPYIKSIAVPGIRSEVLLHFLESCDIYVSSGSACSKGKKSAALSGFGVPDIISDSSIRVSFCADNTYEEIDALAKALQAADGKLIRAAHD